MVTSPSSLTVINPTVEQYGAERVEIAQRLSSLNGKTVGLLWNGKSNGDVALRAASEKIQVAISDVQFRFYSGSGPCPPALLEKAGTECDAFIAAAGDCGGCTAWLVHDCIKLERGGKPTVLIAARGFERDVKASSEAFSMPGLKFVLVPTVYNNISENEARAQTEPVVDDLVSQLTTQLEEVVTLDEDGVRLDRSIEFFTDEPESLIWEFNRVFLDHDWGDGYPLWPPTATSVAELVSAVDGGPDDLVCVLPPGNGSATVQLIAANAAMAGCKPAEMPVIMAILRAIAKLDPNYSMVVTTSTSADAPMAVVNGPIARQLGINGGRCCLGPGKQNEVNIRIGRAVLLCLKNLGRWYPGVLDMDSIGSLRKNVAVIAENEAESPWEPYHVTKGFSPTDSTVTVFWTRGEWDITVQGHMDAQHIADAIGTFSCNMHSYFEGRHLWTEGDPYPLGRLLLLAPPHAQPLSDEGGFTKVALEKRLFDLGQEPIHKLIQPVRKLYKDGKIRPEWEWVFELPEEEARRRTLPVIEAPELYSVVVAGSVRAKDMIMPTRCTPSTERVTSSPTDRT